MKKGSLYPTKAVETWAHFLRTHKNLIERVQQDLTSAELPPLEWYDVLLELKTAPNRRLRLNELGERIVLSKSTLTRVCDRLQRRGLIRRGPCANDGRGVYAVLTDEGTRLQRKMWPVYRAAIERHFASRLTDVQLRRLSIVLGALRKSVTDSGVKPAHSSDRASASSCRAV